ncbi:MAG: adenine phosphoribosyltransferase [Psychroflexus sp.]|nr:adenine phosphoribosyltransferase [Psychroflexus sp.]MDN6311249.1 adenine phosphoribosyltransferase [Psychroflexus sp.]
MNLENYIRDVEDFPKKGVLYKDITPLLKSHEATSNALDQFIDQLKGQKIDKVVGIESRGFLFGILLAQKLNVGFVPIRKPGKLPSETLKSTYDLEYGKDTIEIHKDAIETGEQILLHDDVLATGGTAAAACQLIEELGGELVQTNFLLEISALNGVEKIKQYPCVSLLKY